MGALLFLTFIWFLYSLIEFFNIQSNNKDNIIISEIGMMFFLFVILMLVLGRKVSDNELDEFASWFILISSLITTIMFFYFYNKIRFEKIDNRIRKNHELQLLNMQKQQYYIQTLEKEYVNALNCGDKGLALQKGRSYYRATTNGYDIETRLQNDLLCYLKIQK